MTTQQLDLEPRTSPLRSLVAAIRFLTRVPVPGPDTRVEDLAPAVGFFPLVGAGVGFATAGVFLLAGRLWPPSVAAVLAMAFGLMLTGGFHEDGATDAVDGLGGGWTRERVIEIMKDSRIGAYGAMALVCLLLMRHSSLVALGPRALIAFPLAMALGRWSIALVLQLLPPIASGLAKEVHHQLRIGVLVLSTTFAVLASLGAFWFGLPGVGGAAAAAVVSALVWVLYLRRRMGGHSGDLLGAGNQLVEAAALLALMAS